MFPSITRHLSLPNHSTIQFSCFLPSDSPDVHKLGVSKFRTFRKSEGTDRLLLNINLNANLAPAFNWNIKQLFAFVVAEYSTQTNPINQVRAQLQNCSIYPYEALKDCLCSALDISRWTLHSRPSVRDRMMAQGPSSVSK